MNLFSRTNIKPTIDVNKTQQHQQTLKEQGFVYIDNLNQNFDWIKYAQQLTNTRSMPQDNLELIYDLKAIPNNTLSDGKSQNSLRPHTEASYLCAPPKYLALWCWQPSACGGGYTTLANANSFLRHLTIDEQQRLMQNYLFTNKDGSQKTFVPIVQFERNYHLLFRFSYNILMFQDPSPDTNLKTTVADKFLGNICDRVLDFFEDYHLKIRLEKHSLLIVNNSTMLHSRTAYQDSNRFMQRIWLQ
jgi:alpha-ketoglutarate-dependent taurine dioxygenase